jgi:hypothetical protein
MKNVMAFAMVAVLLLAAACDDTGGTSGGTSVPDNPSVAYKLAAIDGDLSEEAAFQDAIDCIMASGIEGAETEEKVGDTLVASWQQSGKSGTLLEWAQLLCTA